MTKKIKSILTHPPVVFRYGQVVLHQLLPTEKAGQGGVQTQHHQLLSPDQRQPDPEHDHVQARQAPQGSLWTALRKESCELNTF